MAEQERRIRDLIEENNRISLVYTSIPSSTLVIERNRYEHEIMMLREKINELEFKPTYSRPDSYEKDRLLKLTAERDDMQMRIKFLVEENLQLRAENDRNDMQIKNLMTKSTSQSIVVKFS